MTARRYPLGSTDPGRYDNVTPAELEAWNHPEPHSFHSAHVERISADVFRWRDSRTAYFYVGSFADLTNWLTADLRCRTLDPNYLERTTPLRNLSQAEIDDLLGDI